MNENINIQQRRKNTIIITIIVFIVMILGSIITRNSMQNGIYNNFILSNNQPPNYIFGIVWTFLYIGYIIVWSYLSNKILNSLNALFLFNMILNLYWTYTFFYLGDIYLSQAIIILLLITTLSQIYFIWKTNFKYTIACTSYLIVYALWLIVASYLNFNTSYK